MFNTKIAQIVWTLVPLVSLGLAAAVPFVVAAVKGVVKPWVAVVYVVGEIAVMTAVLVTDRSDNSDNPVGGLILLLLMITAATHAALLDNERVNIGK